MTMPIPTIPAVDVARLIIHLAAQEPECERLTPLRVQKLLYYVQGWSLATRGRPLFTERIEAWKNGPVVRAVWQQFRDHGNATIPIDHVEPLSGVPDTDQRLVESVWAGYRMHSASELWRMTHAESPWRRARGGLPEDAPGRGEVTHAMLREHFDLLVSEELGEHQSRLDAAEDRIKVGAFETLEGLRRRVGTE